VNLNLKKPLPKNAIFAVIGGGALLVALIGYMLLIKPQRSQLHEVKQKIAETQKTIDDYRQAAAQSKPTAVPRIKVADIYRLARAMPTDVDMPDVMIELSDLAGSSGVAIDSIQPQAVVPGNGFQLAPIQVTAHGDFYSLTDFIYRLRTLVAVRHGQLEAGGRLFAIESIALEPGAAAAGGATTAAGSDLQATLKLDSFVYGSGAAAGSTAPAAPVPATPSSTDTTTSSAPSASAEGAP
jgi:Tfp pilus assembly protein PilO